LAPWASLRVGAAFVPGVEQGEHFRFGEVSPGLQLVQLVSPCLETDTGLYPVLDLAGVEPGLPFAALAR
jgi:hypothetical protein